MKFFTTCIRRCSVSLLIFSYVLAARTIWKPDVLIPCDGQFHYEESSKQFVCQQRPWRSNTGEVAGRPPIFKCDVGNCNVSKVAVVPKTNQLKFADCTFKDKSGLSVDAQTITFDHYTGRSVYQETVEGNEAIAPNDPLKKYSCPVELRGKNDDAIPVCSMNHCDKQE